jgi:hypothetical protein
MEYFTYVITYFRRMFTRFVAGLWAVLRGQFTKELCIQKNLKSLFQDSKNISTSTVILSFLNVPCAFPPFSTVCDIFKASKSLEKAMKRPETVTNVERQKTLDGLKWLQNHFHA